jgi:hypothetical protein
MHTIPEGDYRPVMDGVRSRAREARDFDQQAWRELEEAVNRCEHAIATIARNPTDLDTLATSSLAALGWAWIACEVEYALTLDTKAVEPLVSALWPVETDCEDETRESTMRQAAQAVLGEHWAPFVQRYNIAEERAPVCTEA